MKKNKLFGIVTVLLAISFSGCKEADYSVIENSIYFSDAAGSSKAITVSLEPTGVDIHVTVRLAQLSDQEVKVNLVMNKDILDEYNQDNSTGFEMIPDFRLPKDAEITIPSGTISGMYKIHLDNFEVPIGKNYAIPLELGEVVSGGIEKSYSKAQFIYLIAKPLIVSVPVMKGEKDNKIKAAPADTDWGIEVKQWSLEFWARMNVYSRNNQAVFNMGSKDHEIYIRFGDANGPYNYLQIKTLRGQVDTPKNLMDNTWYHWALVYNGTTLTIYRNGEPDVMFDPPKPIGDVVRMDFVEMISSGTYFRDECAMCQVRLWKTAITQNFIKNNMYYAIDPKNSSLIAYWPMDEGEGFVFKDITGNGHDATSVLATPIIQRWESGVRFDK